MKLSKILLLLALSLVLFSCNEYAERDYKKLKPPAIVIAKDDNNLIVKDSMGTIYHFTAFSGFGGALVDSYNVGDIIK